MEFNSDICEVMHFRLSSSTPTALPELDLPGFKPRLEWRVWNSARPPILRLLSVSAFLPSRVSCTGKCNPHTETHNQRDSGGKSHQERARGGWDYHCIAFPRCGKETGSSACRVHADPRSPIHASFLIIPILINFPTHKGAIVTIRYRGSLITCKCTRLWG